MFLFSMLSWIKKIIFNSHQNFRNIFVIVLVLGPFSVLANNNIFYYQGRLYDKEHKPLMESNLLIHVQIKTVVPDCVLMYEQHALSTLISRGFFSIGIGKGQNQIFAPGVSLGNIWGTVNVNMCLNPDNNWSPTVPLNDPLPSKRWIIIGVSRGSSSVIDWFSEEEISAVPKSIFAESSVLAQKALSADKLNIMGNNGDILRWNGTEWVAQSLPSFNSDMLADGSIMEAKIANNAITSNKIANNAVTSNKIVNDAVTSDKIVNNAVSFSKIQNISSGRILGRHSTGDGVVEEINIGSGLSLSGGTLTATGSGGTVTSVTSSNSDISVINGTTTPQLTLNSTTSGGTASANKIAKLDSSGLLNSTMIPNLNADKITTGVFDAARIPSLDASKITSGNLSLDRLPVCAPNKILKRTSSEWVCGDDEGGIASEADPTVQPFAKNAPESNSGLEIVSNKLRVKFGSTADTAVEGNDPRLSDSRTPTGAAGGDLSGSYPNPTVGKIQGREVANIAPANGQVLKWNAGQSRWEPANDASGSGVTSVGVSVPSYMSSSGGPITSSGIISLSFNSQDARKVFAAPSGGDGQPLFRLLSIGDIRSTSTGNPGFFNVSGSCPSGQMLNYNSVTDQIECSSYVLADGAVTTNKINDGAVTTNKIQDKAVALTKIQDLESKRILGRASASSGTPEEISLGVGLLLEQETKTLKVGRTSCPPGFTLIGANSLEAFCISTERESPKLFLEAHKSCYDKKDTLGHPTRLCSSQEWIVACYHNREHGNLLLMNDSIEWISDLYNVSPGGIPASVSLLDNTRGRVIGNLGADLCGARGRAITSSDQTYFRCCFK